VSVLRARSIRAVLDTNVLDTILKVIGALSIKLHAVRSRRPAKPPVGWRRPAKLGEG
jgi:hypothetical protein